MSDINPNEDSDFELFEEAGDSQPTMPPEPDGPEPKGNRSFALTAGIIGGIIVLGIIALLVYNLMIAPRQQELHQQQAAQILVNNTRTAQAATLAAEAIKSTQDAANAPKPTLTVLPTDLPTQAASPTSAPATKAPTSVLAQPSSTPPLAGGGTLTAPQLTATMGALQTQLAAVSSSTARPTSLPTTGFADEVGLPGLIGLAAIFVVVILVVRGIRTRK